MQYLKWVAALTLIAVGNVSAWGDIAPPPRKQTTQDAKSTRVVAEVSIKHGAIRGEARNVQAKITIPSYLVAGDVPRGLPKSSPKEGAPAPEAPKTGAIPEKQSSLPSLGTTIAGLALSLAAVSVVFLVRGNQRTKSTAIIALVSAGLLGGWSIAQADIALPGSRGEPTIVIELSDDAEVVTLQLAK